MPHCDYKLTKYCQIAGITWYNKLLRFLYNRVYPYDIWAIRNGAQTIFYGCTEEISKELRRSEIGSHFLVEYPNLPTLREMYSFYTKSALRILSEDSDCIDVSKCEKEQALLVIDSLKGYFGSKDGLMPFVKQTVDYAKVW